MLVVIASFVVASRFSQARAWLVQFVSLLSSSIGSGLGLSLCSSSLSDSSSISPSSCLLQWLAMCFVFGGVFKKIGCD